MRKAFPFGRSTTMVIKETDLSTAPDLPNVASLEVYLLHVVKEVLILSVDLVPGP